MAEREASGIRIVARNRKAYHDYFILETYEAGIRLTGTEVKSVRAGHVNLKDSYCAVIGGELVAIGMHISPYGHGNIFNPDPLRDRKLLMHRREIVRLSSKINAEGYTLIPLSLYFSRSYVKAQLGLCKGKKLYDKREAEAKRSVQRDIDRYAGSTGGE